MYKMFKLRNEKMEKINVRLQTVAVIF